MNTSSLRRGFLLPGVLLFAAWGAAPAFAQWTALDAETSANAVGQYSSLAIVNGNPAIAYWDQTNNDLRYVRATDAAGATWGTPVGVDVGAPTHSVGQYASLAVVNGNPAIAYYDSTNTNVKYVRATDTGGTAWGAPIALDVAATSVGTHTCLKVVNGNPAIAYVDGGNSNPKYIRATDASGTTWGAAVSIDVSADLVGEFASLSVVNGNPALAYLDRTNSNVRFVRATDTTGATWGTPVAIDVSADNVGENTSLIVVNGNPAIAYYDVTNTNVRYVRATNANGTTWGTPVALDVSASNVGASASLAIIGGNPAIAYWDNSATNPKYIAATDASGSTWGSPVAIDVSGSSVGQYTSLAALAGGDPAIAYYDATNTNLRYAHFVPGTASPTPTVTATASPSATPTLTATPTATPTVTPTVSATSTSTPTPSPTATDAPTGTPTATATESPSQTATATETESPTATETETATATETETPTATSTATPTSSPSPTATASSSPSPSPTASPIPVISAVDGWELYD